MNKRICIIGAGPSGITAIKNILDEHLEVVAYDRNKDVGGNWIYNENESHSSVFETTHIISSKTLSQYEDFTFDDFDKTVSDYPSHDELRRYFQAYAKKFDLYKVIQFETLVKHCELTNEKTWEVTIEQNGTTKKELFTDLIVCNGHHWEPRHPKYPGVFEGEYLHSHQFKKAEPFRDKKVLVIGAGNSACDVAVETSRVSKKTMISWRRGYLILPKFLMGIPSDVFASRLRFLPVWLRNKISDITIRFVTGSNEMYGLPKAKMKFGETHPTINSELLYKIRHGKVKPLKDIERFDGHTVHFKDGYSEAFDTVIACTGYILRHPFFDKDFLDYSTGDVPLYLRMFHHQYKNLYFIGMFQPLGCIWPGAELQSKIAARALAGKWQRPNNIEALCKREITHPHIKQVKSPRHTITVDYHKFMRDLKKQLKKKYVSKTV
ncbi:NAD(P)-binding domain-containing protein [Flavobacteriaceae bacterium R38]|nr:NAD(P)-binding domain-containing protein [Flavobacteriaceae bacterium R38]